MQNNVAFELDDNEKYLGETKGIISKNHFYLYTCTFSFVHHLPLPWYLSPQNNKPTVKYSTEIENYHLTQN